MKLLGRGFFLDVRVARAEVIFLGANGQAARAIYSSGGKKSGTH